MAFSVAAIEGGAVFFDIVFGAATNQIVELRLRQISKPIALASETHLHATHHCAIKLNFLFRRGVIGRYS
jgi:hypothetical protein